MPAPDLGYSVERCKDGLSATNALIVGADRSERRQWERLEAAWKEQLKHAEQRENANVPS